MADFTMTFFPKNKLKKLCRSPLFLAIVFFGVIIIGIEAANIMSGQRYAEDPYGGVINVDQQQDRDSNNVGGLTVTDDQVDGQLWGETFGWVEMQPTGISGVSVSVVEEDIDGDQTDEVIGRLSGYGWSKLMGPLYFGQWDEDNADTDNDDSTGVDGNTGVYIDPEGYFQGIAWSKGYGGFSFGDMMLENTGVNTYTDPDDGTDAAADKAANWARTAWIPNIIQFTTTSDSGEENVTSVNLEVSVPNAVNTEDATVNYSATGGDAEGSGTDYTLANGTATISSGTTTNINISINDDGLSENDETIEVTLSSPTNAILGTNTLFTYTIIDDDGVLTIDIVDASDVTVASPSVALSAITYNFIEESTTGTLGTSTQKIQVNNTTNSNAWSATVAATSGATALWGDGGSNTMDFNDDSGAGQLTLDPSVGTVVRDDSGSTAGVSLGTQASFVQGTTENITLFSSSTAALDHAYDLTGVSMSQFVPYDQVPADYTLNLTLTVS